MEENFILQEEDKVEVVAEGVAKGTTLAAIGAEDIDEHTMLLYRQLQQEEVIMEIQSESANYESAKIKLKDRIVNMIKEYRQECQSMNMVQWLDENGNDNYQAEKINNSSVLYTKIGTFTDAGYTSRFFDVLKWWKLVGDIKYKELGVAAAIFLGKPTHNGFQERVFSRGTYSDTKLKKRLKERNFEMSVLNSCNGKKIDEIKKCLKQDSLEWGFDKNNMCVPNIDQANEIRKFFANYKEEINIESESEDVVEATKEDNDDESISIASIHENTNDDEDNEESSLDEFLTSKEYLNEKDDDN